MKSFKNILSEVAQPKPEEEKRFKAQHEIEVTPHPHAGDEVFKGTKTEKPKAKRKADQEGDANYDQAYNESVDLEEDITKMSHGRLKFHMNTGTPHGSYSKDEMKAERDRRLKTGDAEAYKKAKAGLSEAEQLDEIGDTSAGKKKLKNLIVNRTQKVVDAGASIERRPEKAAEYDKAQKRHMKTIGRAATRLAKEEVEQLDELSPNTLHSYIKKASGNLAGNSAANAAVAAVQVDKPKSQKANRKDLVRNIRNRMKGITSASGRLADKANMAENWQEEVPMMMRQLEFISYAAEEIMDYLDMAGDPEEWFQNKLAGIHQSMLSMYAYAQGGRRAGYGFDESADLEEELKGGQKKLDHNKNGKLDAHDFKLMRAKKMKEEADLEEAVFAMDIDYNAEKRLAAAAKAAGLAIKFVQAGGATEMQLRGDKDKITKFLKARRVPASEISRGWFDEETELDEVSQKTLWNYHAKAGADLQKKREKLDKGTLTMKDLKKGQNRVKGLNRAANKMDEEIEQLDELSPKTLKSYQKKADRDAGKSFDKANDIEDKEGEKGRDVWSGTNKAAQKHAALMNRGEKRHAGAELARKKLIAKGHTSPKMSYEEAEQVDEVTRSAVKRPVKVTGPDGITRTVYKSTKSVNRDEHGQEKINTNESVEMLEEAYKAGIVKLKDGSSVVLKKEDADLLNQMFKDLSAGNRKKMQEVAMKDKSGFEEILGFAREAL